MAVEYLDHFTIRCADMERTRSFYCDILGLVVGPRPQVSVPGYWLYCGGIPQVHLGERDAGGTPPTGSENGAFDHVAFRLSNPEELITRLKMRNIPYVERSFPSIGLYQIVVHDPDGILVELNCGSAGARQEA